MNVNPYLKSIVSLLPVAWSAYQAAYPSGSHWSVTVASIIATVLVWLVPNQPKSSQSQQPVNSIQITPATSVPPLTSEQSGQGATQTGGVW